MASMNSVGVKVEPERNSILSGESLVLHIGVENRGPSGIQIPDPDFENPFTYNLASVENPALIYQFSLVRYKVTKNPEDRRIQPYSMVALSPGVRAEYAIDLALVMSEPVRPGNYSLRVTYRDRNLSLSSSPVRLRFLSPQPISLATIGNFDKEGISYVMSNREGDQVTLFQWEAERTNPRLGRAFRRADLSLTSASSVASTFEGEAERGRRWISWLADGNLQIERVWGKSLDRTVRPVLVNLSEARLLSPGRVDAQDKARFLVIGSNGHGDELHEFNAAGRVFVKPEG